MSHPANGERGKISTENFQILQMMQETFGLALLLMGSIHF
jgi:hypothetical protein